MMPKRPADRKTQDDQPGFTTPALPAVAPDDPLIGRTFGSHRLVKLLGEGGMGAVYLGEHPAIRSKVAIKVLDLRYADDPQIVERFFNEARAVNMIGHDNIVQVLDFDVAHGRHYFVMELLAGRTLQQELRGGAALPLARAGPIVLQCCRALQAAHENNIVHRDFKPDNVFLLRRGDRADFVKLVDFGIAKLIDAGAVWTQAGIVLGTPAYMSPEQAAGEPTIDARCDVYSLGVVLFQMVTGRKPFGESGPSVRQILLAHLRDPPPRPRALRPDLPESCEAIILRALEKDPANRFQSMANFHEALACCLTENGLGTNLPLAGSPEWEVRPGEGKEGRWRGSRPRTGPGMTPAPHTSPGGRRRASPTRRAVMIGSVLAIAVGVGGFVVARRPGGSTPLAVRTTGVGGSVGSQVGAGQSKVPADADEGWSDTAEHMGPPNGNPRTVSTPPDRGSPSGAGNRPTSAVTGGTSGTDGASRTITHDTTDDRSDRRRTTQGASGVKGAEGGIRPAKAELVQLRLASQPEAQFIAKWPRGSRAGRTPKAIAVPKNSEVRIRFIRDSYEVAETELTASEDQVVFKVLSPAR